jgi:deoxyribonuclease-4
MLKFGTAGIPNGVKTYEEGFKLLRELGLDSLEVEFVHGVRMKKERAVEIGKLAKACNLTLTCHGPYYINLNAKENEKREASVKRVLNTIEAGKYMNAFSITFHAGFYLKQPSDYVYMRIKDSLTEIVATTSSDTPLISPELTGKETQFGSLNELLSLINDVKGLNICIDFAHLHARTIGKYNTEKEIEQVMEKIIKTTGEKTLKQLHIHMAGIEYGAKGEKKHLNLKESDLNYKGILKVLKNYGVSGVVTCESPNLQEDALLLKETYETL